MDDETRRILSAAKGIIVKGWHQGGVGNEEVGFCVMGAVIKAGCGPAQFDRHINPILAVAAGVPVLPFDFHEMYPIAVWNDNPERTHAEVVALFDKVLTETATPAERELVSV